MTDNQRSQHVILQDWLELIKKALPVPPHREKKNLWPFTLVIARRGTEASFTIAIDATDPVLAVRHATLAFKAVPIPPELEGVGPYEVVDIFKGRVDLNGIDGTASSMAHLLPRNSDE